MKGGWGGRVGNLHRKRSAEVLRVLEFGRCEKSEFGTKQDGEDSWAVYCVTYGMV